MYFEFDSFSEEFDSFIRVYILYIIYKINLKEGAVCLTSAVGHQACAAYVS